jgi:hypothetical protein
MEIVRQRASEANIALKSQKTREPLTQRSVTHSMTISRLPSKAEKGTPMNKTAIVALFTPSLALLLVLALFVGSHADAQTPARLMFANQHCTENTLTSSHESGYVGFVAGASGVQATVSATQAANASLYFKTFRATHGAVALTSAATSYVALGSEPGFEALHGYTHLSETIDFYWNTFVGFGYTAMMKEFTPESMVYLFDNGINRYWAVFTMTGEDVKVSFTPVATLVASR